MNRDTYALDPQNIHHPRWAIHTTHNGRWWAFERYSGGDTDFGLEPYYPSEEAAIAAIRAIDPRGRIRINYGEII